MRSNLSSCARNDASVGRASGGAGRDRAPVSSGSCSLAATGVPAAVELARDSMASTSSTTVTASSLPLGRYSLTMTMQPDDVSVA
jgi:hypothetical protein